ncbi:hypothetical protein LCGC14_2561600, partial [marine sediment metagenome]
KELNNKPIYDSNSYISILAVLRRNKIVFWFRIHMDLCEHGLLFDQLSLYIQAFTLLFLGLRTDTDY